MHPETPSGPRSRCGEAKTRRTLSSPSPGASLTPGSARSVPAVPFAGPALARWHRGDTGEAEGRAQALSQRRAASGMVHGRRRYLQLLREAGRVVGGGTHSGTHSPSSRSARAGEGWGEPRLSAPSGRNTDPQPPPRAIWGRAGGTRPALMCTGVISPAPEQTVQGTATKSDGPVPEPVPNPGGAGGRARLPSGRPTGARVGCGGVCSSTQLCFSPQPVARGYVSFPQQVRNGRLRSGNSFQAMGTLPIVSQVAGVCSSSC